MRYSRQIMLPGLDVAGQEKLQAATVLIVGLGGLGCPAALYLAAAGVGSLVLADGDQVDLSNLQRQIAHGEENLGQDKVASAAQRIRALNSETGLKTLPRRLGEGELRRELAGVDLVLDASDSFATRFAVNQACVEAGRPLVSGAAIRSEGQVAVFDFAGDTPCYRCLYGGDTSDEELSCSESGVLAPMVGVIGSLQALEAVKLLSGFGEPIVGSMLVVDGWSLQVRKIRLKRDPHCPVCGAG
jgi:adenylyltransferase/sulfurtransferase